MALVNVPATRIGTAIDGGERSLVERARAMDTEAWDQLYLEHYGPIRRYASFRVNDPSAADDIAAEVFLEAVRGIQRYRYRGVAFRAWLYRIAHNLTADYRRRSASRQANEAPAEPTLGDLPCEDFVPALERERDLRAAVAMLTEEQQQVVILRFFEGLSLAETAEATGRRAGAIKSLQHRALERLRVILGETS
ncbi:MAG TPA: sigma-70 family RNA polymerase sigma factor [Tepidiformaceae bacterium]|nr:sigma-70 family RNA polymerase sigma factor [Tepidiformaceae bacterium]